MKNKKIIFSIATILIIIVTFLSGSVSAATKETRYFGVHKEREKDTSNGVDYFINPAGGDYAIQMLRFDEYNSKASSSLKTENIDAYCARANRGFETGNNIVQTNTPVEYTDKFILNSSEDRKEIESIKYTVGEKNYRLLETIDEDGNQREIDDVNTYDAILALADLFYLDGMEESEIEKLVNNALVYANSKNKLGELLSTNYNELKTNELQITIQQIKAAQQAALWTFTNSDESGFDLRNKNSWLLYMTKSMKSKPLSLSTKDSSNKGKGKYQSQQVDALYYYLVNKAIENVKAAGDTGYKGTNTVYLYTSNNQANIANTQPVIIIEKGNKPFDVALRKFITKIDDSEGHQRTGEDYNYAERVPNITDSEKTALSQGKATFENAEDAEVKGTTAQKTHTKTKLEVQKGDTVYYKIRVYNESSVGGKVKVKDYLPEGLTLLDDANWDKSELANGKTIITSKNYIELSAFSTESSNTDWYKDIEVKCKVNEKATSGNLKNVAEISEAISDNGEYDIDSTPDNLGDKSDYNDYNPGTTNRSEKGIGYEDDDDFEDLKIVEFDLALRKYITSYTPKNGEKVTIEGTNSTRNPDIDVSTISSSYTTATYKHRKNPVIVTKGATVNYKLTVYNEGDIEGRAEIIKDKLPTGLTFEKVVSGEFDGQSSGGILTLTRKSDSTKKLNPFTKGMKTPDSETIEIQCKVDEQLDNTQDVILTNIAWIAKDSKMSTESSDSIDRDSQPKEYPSESGLVTYGSDVGYTGNTENKTNNLDLNSKDSYFKGEQDDDDFEKIKIKSLHGQYNIFLVKTDSEGQDLESEATFQITDKQKNETRTEKIKGTVNITGEEPINITTTEGTDKYEIKELEPPDEYCKFNGTIKIEVGKKEENESYILDQDSLTFTVEDENGEDITNETGDDVTVYVQKNDDGNFDLYVKVKDYQFDLKLLKRITAVNDKEVKNRITSVDVTPLVDGTDTTAIYKMDKDPVKVKKGDIVTYTLRVYNEGEIDGYASEITEDIPEGLEYVELPDVELKEGETIESTSEYKKLSDVEKAAIELNKKYGWQSSTDESGKTTIKTSYLDKNDEEDNLIKAFDKAKAYSDTETSKNPDYREVQIALRVISTDINSIIRNEAEISDDKDKDGNEVTDRDSTPEEWKKEEDTDKDYDDKGKWHPYKEDDEDYDNIELEVFDLSLRKFISAVGKDETMKDAKKYERAPEVDTSNLNKNDITTATYKHTKQPVKVNVGDYVEYTLRVYNEGTADGYAAEIKDHLPSYLEFVDGEFNKAYNWTATKENGRTVIKTDYLKNTLLKGIEKDKDGNIILDSSETHELKILCRVVTTAPLNTKITNIADISKYEDSNHGKVEDRDSQQDNVNVPAEKDLPSYKDDETGSYIPGQQDDDDFEKVITPQKFDLALRKFITKVDDKDITTRIPQVTYKDGKITYTHPKDAVDVVNGNIVTYTLRIFNEGEVNGYASVITDDIPDGVQFIPNNSINKEYRWVMYEEAKDQSVEVDGEEVVECQVRGSSEVKKYIKTTDVKKAVIIRTDYLSKEQGEARMKADSKLKENPNLIKAFDPNSKISDTNPDYKDIQVAFLVIEPNGSQRILTNYAQISDDTDENGNPVEDIDSTTDKWNEGEDDQDIENIKVPLFDLALRKWVTEAIVIENGKQTVTKTGHDAWDDPEGIVKVELHRKKLSDVTVKFRYSIRVYNQGEIEGYAKEVTDYIPEGLKFVAKDNPGWKDEGNNVISTELLKDTLLKPGEYADVEVLLTWINGTDNLGLKTNTAEISKDYNNKGVPDKDSTPDNKKPGEDDIDDAPVMLSVSTGSEITYLTLGLGILAIIAGGIFLIKKYVL